MMQNPAQGAGTSDRLLGQDAEALCRGAAGPGQGRIQGARRSRAQGPRFSNPLWDTQSRLQLPQAAIPAERRGDQDRRRRHGNAGRRPTASGWNFSPGRSSTCSRRPIFWAPTPMRWKRPWRPMAKAWCRGWKIWSHDIEANKRRSAGHAGRPRGVHRRPEHRHHARVGGVSQPDVGTDPVHAHHRNRPQDPAADLSALDQQVLRAGPEAREQPDQMDRGSGLYRCSSCPGSTPTPLMPIPAMDDYIRDGFLTAMAEVRRITGRGADQRRRLLHRRHHAGPDAGASAKGGRRFGQIGHLLHHADRFFRPGRGRACFWTMILSMASNGRADEDGMLSQSLHVPDLQLSALERPDLSARRSKATCWARRRPPLTCCTGTATAPICPQDGAGIPARPVPGRRLCQGRISRSLARQVSLADVKLPLCAIACETDHIAHWRGSFNGIKQMGSTDKTFILSQSGHIAGIVNPPVQGQIRPLHQRRPDGRRPRTGWRARHLPQGSWWPRWGDWLAERSGDQIAGAACRHGCALPGARHLCRRPCPPLDPASANTRYAGMSSLRRRISLEMLHCSMYIVCHRKRADARIIWST